jgi:hypothetical protein
VYNLQQPNMCADIRACHGNSKYQACAPLLQGQVLLHLVTNTERMEYIFYNSFQTPSKMIQKLSHQLVSGLIGLVLVPPQ